MDIGLPMGIGIAIAGRAPTGPRTYINITRLPAVRCPWPPRLSAVRVPPREGGGGGGGFSRADPPVTPPLQTDQNQALPATARDSESRTTSTSMAEV